MAAQYHATAMAYPKGGYADRRRGSGVKEEWSNKGEKERAQRDKPKMDRNRLAALKKDKKEVSALHCQWLCSCAHVPTRQHWALHPSALRDQGWDGTLQPSPSLPLKMTRTRNTHNPVPGDPNEGRRSLVGVALAMVPGEVVRAVSRLLQWRLWPDSPTALIANPYTPSPYS